MKTSQLKFAFRIPKVKIIKPSHLVPELNAKVLFQDQTYSLEVINRVNGPEFCLVSIKSGRCNWIILYDSQKIAYDYHVNDNLHNRILKSINNYAKKLAA